MCRPTEAKRSLVLWGDHGGGGGGGGGDDDDDDDGDELHLIIIVVVKQSGTDDEHSRPETNRSRAGVLDTPYCAT